MNIQAMNNYINKLSGLYIEQRQEAQGTWAAHLRMAVHKVREKHHPAHQPALMMDLTALLIRSNMKLRINKIIFSGFPL